MATIALDWDDTLVVSPSGDWLLGALDALRRLVGRGHVVLIHSCRANWAEGQDEIRQRLNAEGLHQVTIHVQPGKPLADLYIDDRGLRFERWTTALPEAERLLHEHDISVPARVPIYVPPTRPSSFPTF